MLQRAPRRQASTSSQLVSPPLVSSTVARTSLPVVPWRVQRAPTAATRSMVRTTITKQATATRRQAAVGAQIFSRGQLSLMQTASVAPSTAQEYQALFNSVVEWETFCLGHEATTDAEMDAVLTGLFDEWYLEGENLGTGRKALAAVCFFRPHFGRGSGCHLAACRQALRGWKRLCPPGSRLPLPWPVVAMIANELALMAERECALICLVCFFTYFRPSEPFKLLGKHVVPPVLLAGAGHQHWALTLHPYEEHQPSKTQEFDESILLDKPESFFLGPLLYQHVLRRGLEVPVFGVSQTQFGLSFKAACTRLGLAGAGCPTPYQLRHSGASWEFAAGVRTLAEVQRRGRWRATASVRRYEKGGRVSEQLHKLTPRLRSHAISCANAIVEVVSLQRLPLAVV